MAGLNRVNQHWGQNPDVAWIALLCATAVLYLWGLGSPFAPTNGDEMVYIHIARLTAESGHWLPLVSDLANMRNTKPPLLIWQAMVAGDWGNNWSLLALRLPAVAYTFLTAVGVAVLTHRFSGRSGSPIRSACLAAVLYLAFFSSFRYGRVYLTSAAETFWLALPMFWLLWRACLPEDKVGWFGYVLFGVTFGLGCAYKSFALVAPAAVEMSALVTDDRSSPPTLSETVSDAAEPVWILTVEAEVPSSETPLKLVLLWMSLS